MLFTPIAFLKWKKAWSKRCLKYKLENNLCKAAIYLFK